MDDQSLSCVEIPLDGSMRCDIQMWQNLKVPLLGQWGAISYAPAMVRRQIGSKQFITSGGGLRATISSCLPIHKAFTQDSTLDLDIEFRDFSLNSSIEDKYDMEYAEFRRQDRSRHKKDQIKEANEPGERVSLPGAILSNPLVLGVVVGQP